jgi:hypothetical protein
MTRIPWHPSCRQDALRLETVCAGCQRMEDCDLLAQGSLATGPADLPSEWTTDEQGADLQCSQRENSQPVEHWPGQHLPDHRPISRSPATLREYCVQRGHGVIAAGKGMLVVYGPKDVTHASVVHVPSGINHPVKMLEDALSIAPTIPQPAIGKRKPS